MRARRLQEVFCRSESRRTLRAAKLDERHLLSFLTTVHHFLFLRPPHSWIHGPRFFLDLIKTRKWRTQFVFFRRCHRWVSEATVVVISETASINIIFAFSQHWGFHYFIWPMARESHCRSSSFHRSRWGNLYRCGLWHWQYILNLQYLLSSACWLLFFLHYDSKFFFSLSLRLVPATVTFIIFAQLVSYWGRKKKHTLAWMFK